MELKIKALIYFPNLFCFQAQISACNLTTAVGEDFRQLDKSLLCISSCSFYNMATKSFSVAMTAIRLDRESIPYLKLL